tara:strand:- start:880 stop:1548 length:669 start_codon:yes stop_codon:yes gene_type:complete
MSVEQFSKLLANDEALLPELQASVTDSPLGPGTWIAHPLVHGVLSFVSIANELLRSKQEQLASALAAEDWHSYIWIHERPYRLEALLAIENRLSDESYWTLVEAVWIDSESPHINYDIWAELWTSDRPRPDGFARLPVQGDIITVYRGTTNEDEAANEMGLSWSLSAEVAERFARRYGRLDKSVVIKAHVHRDDVLGYTNNRDEQEVITLNVERVELYSPKE